MFCRFAMSFTLLFIFGHSGSLTMGQDATAQIIASGGTVSPISAQDKTVEVTFNLSEKPITDEQLKPLAGMSDVVWLNLANTKITNEGLQYIAKLPLEKLHLEKTAIGDDGLPWLMDCQKLEYLNLYGTQVTDAGLQSLTGLKSLKKLYLWQTKVTQEGMDDLRKKMPQLSVIGAVALKSEVKESGETKEGESEAKPDDSAKPEAEKKAAADKPDEADKSTANEKKPATGPNSATNSPAPSNQEKSSRRNPNEETKKKKKDGSSGN